ncbi:unnamed protein product [Moneuplotes crassus]|uniref:Uncharacterized protein n=1 Tax=Euplotes crassus TaxID=5936 RepID=A0AAD1XIE6_EUPCR|nr:unnamed protein product [Moneuplotes crassus]
MKLRTKTCGRKSLLDKRLNFNSNEKTLDSEERGRNRFSSASKDYRVITTANSIKRGIEMTLPRNKKNSKRLSRGKMYKKSYLEDIPKRLETKLGKVSTNYKTSLLEGSPFGTPVKSDQSSKKQKPNHLDSSKEIEMGLDLDEFSLASDRGYFDESSKGLDSSQTPQAQIRFSNVYEDACANAIKDLNICFTQFGASKNVFNKETNRKVEKKKSVRFVTQKPQRRLTCENKAANQLILSKKGFAKEDYDPEFAECCNFC